MRLIWGRKGMLFDSEKKILKFLRRNLGRPVLSHVEKKILPRIIGSRNRILINMYRGGGSYVVAIINMAYFIDRGGVVLSEKEGYVASRKIFSSVDYRCVIDFLRKDIGKVCESRLLSADLLKNSQEVKIVARIRNPVDQMRSYTYFLNNIGGKDFDDAVRIANRYCLDYYSMINCLPRDNLLVLKMEELTKNPVFHIEKIVNHIGLEITYDNIIRAIEVYEASNVQKKSKMIHKSHPRTSYREMAKDIPVELYIDSVDKIERMADFKLYEC